MFDRREEENILLMCTKTMKEHYVVGREAWEVTCDLMRRGGKDLAIRTLMSQWYVNRDMRKRWGQK